MLDQDELAILDLKDRKIGDHLADHSLAGQWECAVSQHLAFAVLVRMFHHDHNVFCASHKVHRSAHPFHHLSGNHPVGEVTFLTDLHRS